MGDFGGVEKTKVRYDSIIFTHALSHLFCGLTYLSIADKEKTLGITQLYPIPYTSQIREQIVNSSPKLYLSDSLKLMRYKSIFSEIRVYSDSLLFTANVCMRESFN
jgi:hypothetical protein